MQFNPKTPFWQRLTLMIGIAGHFTPENLPEWARRYGVTGAVIKVADGTTGVNDTELTSEGWMARLRGPSNLPVGAWAYGTGEDGASQASFHIARTRRFTLPTANGNRVFVLNPEFHWRVEDEDAEYWRTFRREAPTMMAAICPEGSEWGPVEGIDYEAANQAAARSIVQTYDGSMNHYRLFQVWRAACQVNFQSYTRMLLGCASDLSKRKTGAQWEEALEQFDLDRRTAGMVKPLGLMIYLGETVTEDEIAGISNAAYRLGLVKA